MQIYKEQALKMEPEAKKLMLTSALDLGAKVELVSEKEDLFFLEYKGKVAFVREKSYSLNMAMPAQISENKDLTKIILKEAGLKVPEGFLVENVGDVNKLLEQKKIDFPIVIKPNKLTCGKGIMVNIKNIEDAKLAIENGKKANLSSKKDEIIVEKYFVGDDFRLLVLDGEVIAVLKRECPVIVGDGKSSVEQLVYKIIRKKKKKAEIDDEIRKNIRMAKLQMEDILETGKKLQIRYNANISTGGRGINVTDGTSARFKKIAVQAIKTLGLTIGGVDFLTKDISSEDSDYVIIEINSRPDLCLHSDPDVGEPIDVFKKVAEKILGIK